MSAGVRLRSATNVLAGGAALFVGYQIYSGNEKFYRQFVIPPMQLLSAERAHILAVKFAAWGLVPKAGYKDPPTLQTKLWNLQFSNPIGLAAGFDKHAEAMDGMLKMGFGFVEIGSVTPEPQAGNPKPRVFRLKQDKAVINRYGFNSDGHQCAYQRLKQRADRLKDNEQNKSSSQDHGIVGINLGKNKTSPDPVGDYVKGVHCLGCLGDYLVINVSSPNTPGLRDMQGREKLAELIDKVIEARDSLPCSPKPPLVVKIAPDLTDKDKEDIAAVVLRNQGCVDGLIISNTTVSRPDNLTSQHKAETGGLSGEPLQKMSTEAVRDMYRLTNGQLPIIGVGGVNSGQSAYEKIRAGASLVQLYTSLTYEGPPLVTRIKRELDDILRADGFKSVSEAVGADHR